MLQLKELGQGVYTPLPRASDSPSPKVVRAHGLRGTENRVCMAHRLSSERPAHWGMTQHVWVLPCNEDSLINTSSRHVPGPPIHLFTSYRRGFPGNFTRYLFSFLLCKQLESPRINQPIKQIVDKVFTQWRLLVFYIIEACSGGRMRDWTGTPFEVVSTLSLLGLQAYHGCLGAGV